MAVRILKKYPNRRLYDTGKSAYITAADVLALIREGVDFQVVDSETGDDLTRSVLIQIITEQEAGSTPIFTTEMLMRFIRLYDDAAQSLFGEFLDRNITMFADQQKRFQDQMGSFVTSPMQIMKEMTERNLSIWTDMQQRFMDMAMGKASAPPDDDKPSDPKKKKPKG